VSRHRPGDLDASRVQRHPAIDGHDISDAVTETSRRDRDARDPSASRTDNRAATDHPDRSGSPSRDRFDSRIVAGPKTRFRELAAVHFLRGYAANASGARGVYHESPTPRAAFSRDKKIAAPESTVPVGPTFVVVVRPPRTPSLEKKNRMNA